MVRSWEFFASFSAGIRQRFAALFVIAPVLLEAFVFVKVSIPMSLRLSILSGILFFGVAVITASCGPAYIRRHRDRTALHEKLLETKRNEEQYDQYLVTEVAQEIKLVLPAVSDRVDVETMTTTLKTVRAKHSNPVSAELESQYNEWDRSNHWHNRKMLVAANLLFYLGCVSLGGWTLLKLKSLLLVVTGA